jgi:hypothetical protein
MSPRPKPNFRGFSIHTYQASPTRALTLAGVLRKHTRQMSCLSPAMEPRLRRRLVMVPRSCDRRKGIDPSSGAPRPGPSGPRDDDPISLVPRAVSIAIAVAAARGANTVNEVRHPATGGAP